MPDQLQFGESEIVHMIVMCIAPREVQCLVSCTKGSLVLCKFIKMIPELGVFIVQHLGVDSMLLVVYSFELGINILALAVGLAVLL